MTVKTYTFSPTIGSFIGFTATGVARPELPGFKRNDDLTTCAVQTITKNDQHVSGFMSFDFGREVETPPAVGDIVLDAYLRLFALGVDTGAMSDIDVSLVAKDGLWDFDVAAAASQYVSLIRDPADDSGNQFKRIVGRNTSGGALFSHTKIETLNGWDINKSLGLIASAIVMGQVIDHGTAGTLGECDVVVRRVGVAPGGGNVILRVHPLIGGIIDTTTVLAASDPIVFSSIGGAFHAETFVFSGGDQLVIADGDELGWSLSSGAPIDDDDYLEVALVEAIAAGVIGIEYAQRGGITAAFSQPNYPIDAAMPLLYESDNSTIRVAPHGSISRIASFPSFPTDNAFVEVHPPNFHTLIQEWIDDAGYVTDGNIGIQLTPSDNTEVPVKRRWDDMELIVTFGTPEDAASVVTVVWDAVIRIAARAFGRGDARPAVSASSRADSAVSARAVVVPAVFGEGDTFSAVSGKADVRPAVRGTGKAGA